LIEELADFALDTYLNEKVSADKWDPEGLARYLDLRFSVKMRDLELDEMRRPDIRDEIIKRAKGLYEEKESSIGGEMARYMEKMVLLQVVDSRWKDHLYAMDSLREGIGLRAYGQRDPLIEYQHEAYAMFMDMIDRIKEETLEYLFKIKMVREERKLSVFDFSRQKLLHEEKAQFQDVPAKEGEAMPSYKGQLPEERVQTYKRETPKVGRNDPCPCGSGRKYKKCCGR
jgi:preprotein translocase subunit SecA